MNETKSIGSLLLVKSTAPIIGEYLFLWPDGHAHPEHSIGKRLWDATPDIPIKRRTSEELKGLQDLNRHGPFSRRLPGEPVPIPGRPT